LKSLVGAQKDFLLAMPIKMAGSRWNLFSGLSVEALAKVGTLPSPPNPPPLQRRLSRSAIRRAAEVPLGGLVLWGTVLTVN